jgi:hypothetical protein
VEPPERRIEVLGERWVDDPVTTKVRGVAILESDELGRHQRAAGPPTRAHARLQPEGRNQVGQLPPQLGEERRGLTLESVWEVRLDNRERGVRLLALRGALDVQKAAFEARKQHLIVSALVVVQPDVA